MYEYDQDNVHSFNLPLRSSRRSEFIDSLISLINSDPKFIKKTGVLKFLRSIEFDQKWVKSFHYHEAEYSNRFLLGIGISRLIIKCRKCLQHSCELIQDHFIDRNRKEIHKLIDRVENDNELFNSLLIPVFIEVYFDFFISRNRVLELMTAPVFLFKFLELFIKNNLSDPNVRELGIGIFQLPLEDGDLIPRSVIEQYVFNQIQARTTKRGTDSNTRPYLIRHFALKLFEAISQEENVRDPNNTTTSDAKYIFIGVLFCYLQIPDYPDLNSVKDISKLEVLHPRFYSKIKEKVKYIIKEARADLKKGR